MATRLVFLDDQEMEIKAVDIEPGDDYELSDLAEPKPAGCEEVRLWDDCAMWSITLWRARHTR